jgi:hypothetical protein
MAKSQQTQRFDLGEKTFEFARKVALYIKKLPTSISNMEYGRQVVASSGSGPGKNLSDVRP